MTDMPSVGYWTSYVELHTTTFRFRWGTIVINPDQCPQVVFLTDALSVLEALDNGTLGSLQNPPPPHPPLSAEIDALCCSGFHLTCIPGNETADRLAKQGAAGEKEDNTVSFQEMKTLTKACNRTPKQTEDHHMLTNREKVVIFRLRTGRNRLNQHMHIQCRPAPSPLCPCGEAEQSAHLLQDCLNHQRLRRDC